MEFLAAIHVPEIFGTHPVFIGNFDRSPKKALHHPAGCSVNGFIASGLRNGHW
jgi:hypothetical protein